MIRALSLLSVLCAAILLAPSRSVAITMAWSPVGNPGNAADPLTGFGAVNYSYSIGTYDVTASQYVAFLNANDPSGVDALALYNSNMSSNRYGEIYFSSAAAAGTKYSVMPGLANLPINNVTWYDAIRFANWMDNGRPVFTTEPTATNNATENGSYALLGFTATPSNGNSVTRSSTAVIVLPSENEWYKAAYYNPATSSYFIYPTSSDSTPNASDPTSIPNSANYNVVVDNLTTVGAYSGTTSPYGAYDMGGDVFQWNEALIYGDRGLRGGVFDTPAGNLLSSVRADDNPANEGYGVGFRLAMVPEPSSIVLALLGCAGALALRKRLK
jgi:sulfatase modifying factor 1